jgi:peroxiredoxin-like protein
METGHLYKTSLSWAEMKKGTLTSPDLPDIAVATPPEFPGGHAGYWSPETLFVAAAESCLMTTFLAIAENSKLSFSAYTSEAEGTVTKTEEGYRVTEIRIRAKVTIADETKQDRTRRLLEKAEQHCLISNSMKTAVHLEAEVAVG